MRGIRRGRGFEGRWERRGSRLLLKGAVGGVAGGDEAIVRAEEGAVVGVLAAGEGERGVVGGGVGVFEAEVGVVDEEEAAGL